MVLFVRIHVIIFEIARSCFSMPLYVDSMLALMLRSKNYYDYVCFNEENHADRRTHASRLLFSNIYCLSFSFCYLIVKQSPGAYQA